MVACLGLELETQKFFKPLLVAVGLLSDLGVQDGDALVSVSFSTR